MVESQRQFLRGLLVISGLALVFFTAEFFWEWDRLGRPGLAELSWADANNAKLVDVLSAMGRANSNMLAMLLATIGLAIPLTANMHTPKLIDMFLRDRVNQIILSSFAFAAAHVHWTAYVIGPHFAPMWIYRLSVLGAVVGWLVLVPYFYYVMRFLDPSNILARLKLHITRVIARFEAGTITATAAHDVIVERLFHMGTIVLKSIDRADRGVVQEGIWSLKQLLDYYGALKARLPAAWFHVERKDFVGLTAEAIEIVNEDRTWFEQQVMMQLFLAYQGALTKTQDVISSLSDAVRVIAVRAAQRGDDKALRLAVRFFNNYLREAIKRKELHAIYDLLCQYRLLANDLSDRPPLVAEIGVRIRMYSELAATAGLEFVQQIAGFDLKGMAIQAYERGSPAAPALLAEVLALKHQTARGLLPMLLKAKLILGGFFFERGLEAEAAQVRANLAGVPQPDIAAAQEHLLNLGERTFWEVTDRQVNFEWVAPEHRPSVQAFINSLRFR